MAAYLFTWNPAKFEWEANHPGDIARIAKQSREGKAESGFMWSCSRSTKPQRGDRAFIIKLGKQGRGVFASGWITRGSHVRKDSAFGPRGVILELDVFLNPTIAANLLDPTNIKVGEQHWTPENSGTTINSTAHGLLEVRWAQHVRRLGQSPALREVSEADAAESVEFEALEGELRMQMVRHRYRERAFEIARSPRSWPNMDASHARRARSTSSLPMA